MSLPQEAHVDTPSRSLEWTMNGPEGLLSKPTRNEVDHVLASELRKKRDPKKIHESLSPDTRLRDILPKEVVVIHPLCSVVCRRLEILPVMSSRIPLDDQTYGDVLQLLCGLCGCSPA